MADVAEREKAEKLAAAKKRIEQLKRQKEKGKKTTVEKKEDLKPTAEKEAGSSLAESDGQLPPAEAPSTAGEPPQQDVPETSERHDTIPIQDTPSRPSHERQPSLSIQSKMRSSSFRRTSVSQTPLSPTTNGSKALQLPALSPEGDTVAEIYRKQAFRLDEMERENKRLAKEAEAAESRWRKTEEELEDLRENNGQMVELKSRADKAHAHADEITKLKSEVTSLQRQNSHLQSLTSKTPRSPSHTSPQTPSDILAQLASKSATIESMEMEISNLHANLSTHTSTTTAHTEQITALEEKLDKAERAAGAAQRELLDVRKNLDRASEKAVKEGSERTSAETKIRTLSREAELSAKSAEESLKRVETLEKKLAALTTLHKESDARRRDGERERIRLEKEIGELRKRMAGVENENLRLREERERLRKKNVEGGDDGLEELEDEERKRLERKVRDLEGEVFELRKGVWKEKKRELADGDEGPGSPDGGRFDEVDLSGPMTGRRQSLRSGGFVNALSSGFSALSGGGGERQRESMDLLPDDEEDGFDEDAFRMAQEDEARKRVERVKEMKRGLKDWEGWRMDIVDSRLGGGGAGEIFDI